MSRPDVRTPSSVTPEEWAQWEAQLPPVWRRPKRETPVGHPLLADLLDAPTAVSPQLLARLQGTDEYHYVAPVDPDRPVAGRDPADVVVSRENVGVDAVGVRRMLRTLPRLEAAVMRLRYGIGGEPITQEQTAARLGMCRKTVYNVEQRALGDMRQEAAEAAGGGSSADRGLRESA